MTLQTLLSKTPRLTLSVEGDLSREITGVYCCDLLSFVMSRAPAGCAWATVMGNVNIIAVAVLDDIAAVIVADRVKPDPLTIQKAQEQGVNLLLSDLPVYDTAKLIDSIAFGELT
jgi:hypothetical protein